MWTKPGRAEAGRFTTTNSDGALVLAVSTPTAAVFYDGVSDTSTVTITSDGTGEYKWAFTVSDAAVPGTRAELRLHATVGSIATGDVISVGRVVPADRWDSVMSDTDRFDTNVVYVSDVLQSGGDLASDAKLAASDALGGWAATVGRAFPANFSDLSIVAVTGAVTPTTADGVSWDRFGGYLMAALFGKAAVSDIGGGQVNVKFANRAATSDLLIVTVSDVDGARSASVAY